MLKQSISRLSATVSLSLVAFACSEGNYTPTVTNPNPQVANTNGTNTGFGNGYQNGINPFLQPGVAYNQLPQQQLFALRMSAQQNLNNCAIRQTPNFYYYQQSQTNNCAVRRTVSYTPSSCACIQAPCDCEQVVQQIRTRNASHCTVLYSSDSHGNPTAGVSSSTSSNEPSSSSSTGIGSSSSPGSTAGTSGINENSTTLPLSITGADARALYERLAREEEETNNDTKTKIRTGANYKCMQDYRGRHDRDFACDIDVSVADGTVYQLYPMGQNGQADLSSPTAYQGPNVQIGGTGLSPEEGFIKVQGQGAKFLYKKLTSAVTQGTIDTAGQIAANIKLGKNVKCYETTGTASPVNECEIKINSTTGAVETAN